MKEGMNEAMLHEAGWSCVSCRVGRVGAGWVLHIEQQ